MMGDIVTDLAAVLQGGMGMAASGNVGDKHGMFEGIHGSAPKMAGQNTDLDKSVLDALAEPMAHLVRNAADHGVDAGRLGPVGRLRRFPRLAEVEASAGGGGDPDDVA